MLLLADKQQWLEQISSFQPASRFHLPSRIPPSPSRQLSRPSFVAKLSRREFSPVRVHLHKPRPYGRTDGPTDGRQPSYVLEGRSVFVSRFHKLIESYWAQYAHNHLWTTTSGSLSAQPARCHHTLTRIKTAAILITGSSQQQRPLSSCAALVYFSFH